MLRKTIEIATPGTRLSVAHRQLVIERPELPKATVPIEDLGVLVIDEPRASYTQAVFIECLAAGATVIVSGRDHLPAGMMLPMDGHHALTSRHWAQVVRGPEFSPPEADRNRHLRPAETATPGRRLRALGRGRCAADG